MKNIIIASILTILVNNCNGQVQTKNNNLQKDIMEYFDINKYKNLKPNPKYSGGGNYLALNGDEIRVIGSTDEGPTISIKKRDTPITLIYAYHKNNLLKAKGQQFYGMIYGTWKEYDEKGKMIKETNYDKDYKFSVTDLEKKMNEEYKVNILDIKQTHSVSRFKGNYKIICDPIAEVIFTEYEIDGTTGKTISIKKVNGDTDEETIIFEKK